MTEQPKFSVKVAEGLRKLFATVKPTVKVSVQLAAKVTVEQFLQETKSMNIEIDEIIKFPCGEPATVFITATPTQVLQLQWNPSVDGLDSNEPIPGISELELIPH